MKLALTLSIQLTAFFATAAVCVWLMTRPTPAAKRVFGIARLLPGPHETRGLFSRNIQDRLLRVAHFVGGWLGIATGEKLRRRFLAAGLRNQSSMDVYLAARL